MSDSHSPVVILGDPGLAGEVYSARTVARAEAAVGHPIPVINPSELAAGRAVLDNARIVLGTWGMPRLDERALRRLPNLSLVLYAAGTISGFATDAMWARGIRVSTATYANSIPVAEFTVASILFALKRAFHHARLVRAERGFSRVDLHGAYASTVGLISLGEIARIVLDRLRATDLRFIAHDPFVDEARARELGVELVDLPEVFERSAVVSLHTPLLPSTAGMITADLLDRLPPGAAFINTARGMVVHEADMIAVAGRRPDLQFILDVTNPEPPRRDSPLYQLENVFLTPHLAGSMGPERQRLGDTMVDELERELAAQPLRFELRPELLANTAHGPRP